MVVDAWGADSTAPASRSAKSWPDPVKRFDLCHGAEHPGAGPAYAQPPQQQQIPPARCRYWVRRRRPHGVFTATKTGAADPLAETGRQEFHRASRRWKITSPGAPPARPWRTSSTGSPSPSVALSEQARAGP